MGTHPIFESDLDCLTAKMAIITPLIFAYRNRKHISVTATLSLTLNVLLSTLFVICRKLPGLCKRMPTHEGAVCDFDWREMEALMFLSCIVVIKTRSALSWYQTYSTALQFSKITSAYLFFRMNVYVGLVYCLACVIRLYCLPDDEIRLPDNITYINDLAEVKKDYWLLELYTTWSPACQKVAPVFADLSRDYGCDKLKFGKVDVGRNQEIAKKFNLRIDSVSGQVPTMALMKDGECVEIRPEVSGKGKLTKFHFSAENIIREFHLNQVFTKINGGGDKEDKKSK